MEGGTKMKKQKRMADILVFVFLAIGSVVMLYPFIWMIFTSFKPKMHIYLAGLLPQTWDFSSYIQIWDEIPLIRGFLNTILYSIPPVVIGSLVSAGRRMPLQKSRFKAETFIFLIFLSALCSLHPS
jgi:multiple sugar transport system permease protein